jgi:hypothetical protein
VPHAGTPLNFLEDQMNFRNLLWLAALGTAFSGHSFACLNAARPHLGVVAAAHRASSNAPVINSIVGLWQVTYTSGGALWDMSFDTWHADGTENENTMDSPLISAVCWGVWEQIGPRTAKLHHVGWNYDSTGTVLLGTFTFDQTDTLTEDGYSYTGTFSFQLYDLNGNPQGAPTTGQVSSVRITVP